MSPSDVFGRKGSAGSRSCGRGEPERYTSQEKESEEYVDSEHRLGRCDDECNWKCHCRDAANEARPGIDYDASGIVRMRLTKAVRCEAGQHGTPTLEQRTS